MELASWLHMVYALITSQIYTLITEHKHNLCTTVIINLLGPVVYLHLQPFSVCHSMKVCYNIPKVQFITFYYTVVKYNVA
jgi:hypothetical protein